MSVNENLRPLTINIRPAFDGQGMRRPGLFLADLDGRQLCNSRQPLLDASRVLLAEGVNPETPIASRHAGSGFDAMTSTVGAAVKWTVREDETRSPHLAAYKAFSCDDVQPPMRSRRKQVSDAATDAERIHDADRGPA